MSPQRVIVLGSKRPIGAHVLRLPVAIQSRYELSELECSDYGRDPRFLPGWWITPTCFFALVGVLAYLIT